jgi:hypothetical protein
MCLACDMEAMWFAVMEARTAAGATMENDEPQEPATFPSPQADADDPLLLPSQSNESDDPLLPPPQRGRVGEGVAGGTDETADMRRESEDPHPNPPPEEGGGGASAEFASNDFASNDFASNEGAPNEDVRQRERVTPPRRFACEETSAE